MPSAARAGCTTENARTARVVSQNRTLCVSWFGQRGPILSRRSLAGSLLLLDLERGSVGLALVVDPAYLQIVALVGALECEFDVRVLGDSCPPIGNENRPAVMFEREFLDEMRRDECALVILYEAGIHRMLDQRLHFSRLAIYDRTHADTRCHVQPPQPPTVTLTSLVALKSLPPDSTITVTVLVFAILRRLAILGSVPCGIL